MMPIFSSLKSILFNSFEVNSSGFIKTVIKLDIRVNHLTQTQKIKKIIVNLNRVENDKTARRRDWVSQVESKKAVVTGFH